jgi:hypothetical protein
MKKREVGFVGFSVEHHCYTVAPGKVNQMIYRHMILDGIAKRKWVVKVNIKDITDLHRGTDDTTLKCLNRLMYHKLIHKVCRTKTGFYMLVPALAKFVAEPSSPRNEAVHQEKGEEE